MLSLKILRNFRFGKYSRKESEAQALQEMKDNIIKLGVMILEHCNYCNQQVEKACEHSGAASLCKNTQPQNEQISSVAQTQTNKQSGDNSPLSLKTAAAVVSGLVGSSPVPPAEVAAGLIGAAAQSSDDSAAHTATLVTGAQDQDGPTYQKWDLDERVADRRKGERRATGLSTDYYKVAIENPTTPGATEYVAECNDIIEALEMPYAHANVFKAIWRLCAAKKGLLKVDYPGTQYDAEKAVFFANRVLVLETPAPTTEAKDDQKS